MPILSVWIINKSGGLIFQKDFPVENFTAPKLNSNDFLVLAGTFQSVHAIATQLNPTGSKCSGIESVEWYGYTSAASTLNAGNTAAGTGTVSTGALSNSTAPTSTPFKLTCSQTPTGLKLLLLTSPRQPQLDYILKRIHEIYSDYALKNPFQTPEMPVRSEKFEAAVGKLVKQMSTNNYN